MTTARLIYAFVYVGLAILPVLLAYLLWLRFNRKKMVLEKSMNWFEARCSEISIDRSGKTGAQMQVEVRGESAVIHLSRIDYIYRTYVTNKEADKAAPPEIFELCVSGSKAVAFRIAGGEPQSLTNPLSFATELTPPDPAVIESQRREGIVRAALPVIAVLTAVLAIVGAFMR